MIMKIIVCVQVLEKQKLVVSGGDDMQLRPAFDSPGRYEKCAIYSSKN